MDGLSRHYITEMRIAPGVVVTVRWYRAPPGARALPSPHQFGARAIWESDVRPYPHPGLGETTGDFSRFDRGDPPQFSHPTPGQQPGSPLEWFRTGVPLDVIESWTAGGCVLPAVAAAADAGVLVSVSGQWQELQPYVGDVGVLVSVPGEWEEEPAALCEHLPEGAAESYRLTADGFTGGCTDLNGEHDLLWFAACQWGLQLGGGTSNWGWFFGWSDSEETWVAVAVWQGAPHHTYRYNGGTWDGSAAITLDLLSSVSFLCGPGPDTITIEEAP
ncbi:MAG: hypothetical protein L0Z62_47025 [Gemmataceae bacterium]|nr:hypothetical protein [Gemmataceae bacterium]